MTESLKKILIELRGSESEALLPRLYEENELAKSKNNYRLAADLNNLIFFLQNPGIKPGGVKEEDLEAFKEFQSSVFNN